LGVAWHHVASAAAGHSFLNSQAEGVAPAAQFLPVLGTEFSGSNAESPVLR